MVYQRRRFARRKRVSRLMKRRGAMNRRVMSFKPVKNYYKFKRYCEDSTLINSGTGTVSWNGKAGVNWSISATSPDDNGLYQFGGSMSFRLDDVLQDNEFISLFDKYKITGVKLTFIPLSYDAAYVSTGGNSSTIPTMTYAIDTDDVVVPNLASQLLVKQDVRVKRLSKPFSVYIKPRINLSVQAAGGSTDLALSQKSGWLNCSYNDIEHFGFKFYLRDMPLPTTGSNSLIRVQAKYYIALKDPQ